MDKIGISRNDMLKYFEEINCRLAKDEKEVELFELIKKYTRASLQTIESKFFTTEAFERYMQEQDV